MTIYVLKEVPEPNFIVLNLVQYSTLSMDWPWVIPTRIFAFARSTVTKHLFCQQRDEEKASLIAELTAQNSRLTTQLKESSAIEANLIAQLEGLKDQCSMRKTSLQVRISSIKLRLSYSLKQYISKEIINFTRLGYILWGSRGTQCLQRSVVFRQVLESTRDQNAFISDGE